MKCSGCDRGKEGKCTRYQRRWDFYEWVDAFKGPKVNSLSKMIYWRKIHFFYVTPWKLFFFPSSVLGTGSARAEPEGCTNTPLPPQPCLDRRVQWVGNVAVRSVSQLSLSGVGWEPPQPHRWRIRQWESCCWALTTSPTALGSYCSVPYFSTASCWEWQKNRRRCKGLFPWTPVCGVEGTACEAGSDLGLWRSGQFQSCSWFV